jgi:hypothetical protein
MNLEKIHRAQQKVAKQGEGYKKAELVVIRITKQKPSSYLGHHEK